MTCALYSNSQPPPFSRGVLLEGVMVGEDMLSFIDLSVSALERSPSLLPWIQSWCLDSSVAPLAPEDWYVKGHGIVGGERDHHGVWIPSHAPGGQTLLWAPPPAAADAALEKLITNVRTPLILWSFLD